jgi:hypothetical protein
LALVLDSTLVSTLVSTLADAVDYILDSAFAADYELAFEDVDTAD